MQAPAPHSSHSRCGCAIRTAGSQSRASAPPSDPQPSRYTIIITRLLLTARGCLGLGWLLEKSGQRLAGSHPGSFLEGREMQRGGGRSPPGELAQPLAPSDRRRPQAVEVWLYSPRVPSQQVTLGSCAFGAAGTAGGGAPCGWRAGTGRVGGRCPLHPRAGAAGWPRGRRISVCTCAHVRARVPTAGCACMCVSVCLCACVCTCVRAGSRRRSGGRCAERRGGWAPSGRSVLLASLRRTNRRRSRLTRGDVDAANPQI